MMELREKVARALWDAHPRFNDKPWEAIAPGLRSELEVEADAAIAAVFDHLESVTGVARVCHEVNRALCEAAGDHSQVDWEHAEPWQRESAEKGVAFAVANPAAPASAQHEAWMADKIAAGWVYGEVKDPDAKTHPCLVPYDDLPFEQRVKDHAFKAVVAAMSGR